MRFRIEITDEAFARASTEDVQMAIAATDLFERVAALDADYTWERTRRDDAFITAHEATCPDGDVLGAEMEHALMVIAHSA